MCRKSSRTSLVATWFALLGCADRNAPPAEPDRVGLCARHCAQLFGPCNPDPPQDHPDGPQTEDECNSTCVSDTLWEHKCRFKYGDQLTCTNELDCDEFEEHQKNNLESPCFAAASALASCIP